MRMRNACGMHMQSYSEIMVLPNQQELVKKYALERNRHTSLFVPSWEIYATGTETMIQHWNRKLLGPIFESSKTRILFCCKLLIAQKQGFYFFTNSES